MSDEIRRAYADSERYASERKDSVTRKMMAAAEK